MTAHLRVAVDVRCLAQGAPRGFARYTSELLPRLRDTDGVEVVAVSDEPPPTDLPVPLHLFGGAREIVREQIALPRLLRRLRSDVLLVPSNHGLPLLATCPSVLTLHDAVEWDASLAPARSGRARARFAYAAVASLAGATEVVTVSRFSAEEIRRRLGIPPDELHVVHEAAADRFFAAGDEAADAGALRRYGAAPGSILYVGGFDAKKDVPTLVQAYARLTAAPQLVLAGARTPEAGDVERLAHELGIAERVRFAGFVADADLPALYRSAAIFAFPAVSEGFGLPVLEAMAAGAPVVYADAAALPEVAGDAGYAFRPRDDRALADVLGQLLADDDGRRRLADRGRAHAQTFSWERTARETLAVVRRAAAVSQAARAARATRRLRALPRWLR